jgi:hypothetical protein
MCQGAGSDQGSTHRRFRVSRDKELVQVGFAISRYPIARRGGGDVEESARTCIGVRYFRVLGDERLTTGEVAISRNAITTQSPCRVEDRCQHTGVRVFESPVPIYDGNRDIPIRDFPTGLRHHSGGQVSKVNPDGESTPGGIGNRRIGISKGVNSTHFKLATSEVPIGKKGRGPMDWQVTGKGASRRELRKREIDPSPIGNRGSMRVVDHDIVSVDFPIGKIPDKKQEAVGKILIGFRGSMRLDPVV